MRPPEEVRRELVRQWRDKAEQDMKAAEILVAAEPPFRSAACFHAQQAAEKYLKAFLTHHQIEFPKTHAIEELLELARPRSADLALQLKDAASLSPYGVDVRCPGDAPEPDLDEARKAIELARKVRDTVLSTLGKADQPEGSV